MEDLPSEAPARHGQRRHGFSKDEEHGEQMSEETSQEDVQVDLGHVQAGDHCEAAKRRGKVKVKRRAKFSLSDRKARGKKQTQNQEKGKADARAPQPDTCSSCGNILPLHQQGAALTESCLRQLSSSCTSHEARHGKTKLSCSGASMEPVVVQAANSLSTVQPSQEADMQVIVRTITGSIYVVDVQPNDSIGHLKFNIWCETRKQPDSVTLICAGRLLRPDAPRLMDFGIVDGSVIHAVWEMSPYLHLFISSSLDGGFYPLLMHPDETVRDLKQRIQTRECLLVRSQQLLFGGQILDDDHRLSCYSTLVTGSVLDLQLRIRTCSTSPKADFLQ